MKIAIIGCGSMGSMLARHIALMHSVILCDRNKEKGEALAKETKCIFSHSPQQAIEEAEGVILAFKPKDLEAFSQQMGKCFLERHFIISILAGTSLLTLNRYFPQAQIIRGMPNLALTCAKGVMGLTAHLTVDKDIKEKAHSLFEGLGLITWVTEEKLEALSVLTGSAPAFIFVMIEAMIDSGIALGFSSHESKRLVLKTLEGSVELLSLTEKSPTDLKWQITSPGGSTIAGLEVLESRAIRGIIMQTYQASFKKVQSFLVEG
ncbi:pyrroline-5-carboxylate reductase [Rhabdochlamydiaceae symbiont of Dictyostelium giganteum]|uniref:pyrroline-5-carboxylate reductase n=1 Tax=Rhabdochlamydiaceae symbiont of Dictyostelium giganteum TaxID=3342349 RepID=UPI00384CB328